MGRSFFKSNLPDSTRPNPLEAFVFDGGQGPITLISSIKDRAFIEKVGTQAAADFEMYALNLLRFFFLTLPTQRLDQVLLRLYGGGGPLWAASGKKIPEAAWPS